jgi:hypothetical protein
MLDINLFREGMTKKKAEQLHLRVLYVLSPSDEHSTTAARCDLVPSVWMLELEPAPCFNPTPADFRCIVSQRKGATLRKSESHSAEDISTEMTKMTKWL